MRRAGGASRAVGGWDQVGRQGRRRPVAAEANMPDPDAQSEHHPRRWSGPQAPLRESVPRFTWRFRGFWGCIPDPCQRAANPWGPMFKGWGIGSGTKVRKESVDFPSVGTDALVHPCWGGEACGAARSAGRGSAWLRARCRVANGRRAPSRPGSMADHRLAVRARQPPPRPRPR